MTIRSDETLLSALHVFMERSNQRVSWLRGEHMEVYVRRSIRFDHDRRFGIDVASITYNDCVRFSSLRILAKFLDELEGYQQPIFLENLTLPAMQRWFERRGYQKQPSTYGEVNYIKLP